MPDPGFEISLGEGWTALLESDNLARRYGLAAVLIKDESTNGSFRALRVVRAVRAVRHISQLSDLKVFVVCLSISTQKLMDAGLLLVFAIVVTAIAGVQADGSVVYAETSDAEFSLNFGIGPGCIQGGGEIRAVPPVRIRELAEQFQVDDEQVLFSICEQDQSPAVQAIGDRIFERMPASCYPICAFDMDPSTEVVEGNCSVKIGEGSDAIEVMECLRDGADYVEQEGGYVMPNEGADVCFAMLGDSTGATPSALDDVQSECADEGFNLGLAFERRDGAPYSAADQLSVNCQLEPEWQLHCPGIN